MAVVIRKNDVVQVITGKDGGRLKAEVGEARKPVGRRGRVLSVDPQKGKAVVEGINIARKHQRPNPQKNMPGGRIDKPMPLPLSRLRLVCPTCGPVRVRIERKQEAKSEGGRHVTLKRLCRKCGHNFG